MRVQNRESRKVVYSIIIIVVDPAVTERSTHDVNELLHLAHTFGCNLSHLERYQRTEFISLGEELERRALEQNACVTPSRQDFPESGAESRLVLEQELT